MSTGEGGRRYVYRGGRQEVRMSIGEGRQEVCL